MTEQFNQAMSLYRSGEFDQARTIIDSSISGGFADANVHLLSAAIYAAQGHFPDVITACEQVLELDSNNVPALFNAAIAADKLAQYGRVVELVDRLDTLGAANAQSRWLKLVALKQLDRTAEAVDMLIAQLMSGALDDLMLRRVPLVFDDYPPLLEKLQATAENAPAALQSSYVIFLISIRVEDYAMARQYLGSMSAIDLVGIYSNRCRAALAKATDGAAACLAVLAGLPREQVSGDYELMHLYADCHRESGDMEGALASLQVCINLTPERAQLLHEMGMIYDRMLRTDDAINAYRASLQISADSIATRYNLALVLIKCGDTVEALALLRECIAKSDEPRFVTSFVRAVSRVHADQLSIEDREQVIAAISDARIDPRDLSVPAIAILLSEHAVVKGLYDLTVSGNDSEFYDSLAAELPALVSDSLLCEVYANLPITDRYFEHFTTMLRSGLLRTVSDPGVAQPGIAVLCSAIAKRAYISGYIFTEEEGDSAVLDGLIDGLLDVDPAQRRYIDILCATAMFRPLFGLIRTRDLVMPESVGDAIIDDMFKVQYLDPLSEADMQGKIESIGHITDDVSQTVRGQYEHNPYPVWERLDRREPVPVHDVLSEAGFATDKAGLDKIPAILIAGSGTGSHVIQTAMRIRHASIMAIDLSRASLAFAMRKSAEYGLDNISFVHMDILNAAELGRTFDLVESVGVLHHMEDPAAGLLSLVDVLKPGGLVNLGFYSQLGRRHILAAKSVYDKSGYVSDDDIRSLRRDILNSGDSEMMLNVTGFRDFYSLDECRDMIFHEHENNYDIPGIRQLVERAGLEFIGFDLVDKTVLDRFRKMFPGTADIADLTQWAEFENVNPDTFAGMYVFWCRKPR